MYQGNCSSFLILFDEFTIGPTTQAVLLIHIKCTRSLPSAASANSSLSDQLDCEQSQISVGWTSPTKNCTTTNNSSLTFKVQPRLENEKFTRCWNWSTMWKCCTADHLENFRSRTLWSQVADYVIFLITLYENFPVVIIYTRSSVTKMCLFNMNFFSSNS